jgi:hypothetical protein
MFYELNIVFNFGYKEFFTTTNVDVKLYYDEMLDPSHRLASKM